MMPDYVRFGPYMLAALRGVLACNTCHDHNGHAYLRVDARSIFDLGAQIGALVVAIDSEAHPEGAVAKDSGGELHDDGSVAPAVESQSTQRRTFGVA
jgi:hypothetical protein